MKKTNRMAQITQRMYGCTDKIVRRVWTDGGEEFVRVNGEWFNLWNVYGQSRYHTIETWHEPVGK